MENPDLRLEKIHRQAEGNPIIALAQHVREGRRLKAFKTTDPRVSFRSRRDLDAVLKAAADSSPLATGILCWTNKMRIQLNMSARKARGYRGAPGNGEVLMCLRNRAPVYNGMRGVLEGDSTTGHKPWLLDVRMAFPEEEIPVGPHRLCAAQFNRVEGVFGSVDDLRSRGIHVHAMRDAGEFYDFGYALTVHKSQGSQMEHAIVVMGMPESYSDFARWGYTAITRAQTYLTILH
jgi:exodeoxyribonuclease V